LGAKLKALTKPVDDLEKGMLVSASYDGDKRVALLKFYDEKNGRFWIWEDNTGHRPYCYTRLPREELTQVEARKDVVGIVEEEKLDLLNDTKVTLRKIVTTDPLAIGGGNDSIRDMIRAWEADIKYYENFAYDRGLRMGTFYKVAQGEVIPVKHDVPERVAHSLEEIYAKNPPEFTPYLREWAELLGEPLVEFRRIALDIEVANESGRLPDPENPKQEVIAVSFFNHEERVVYLLRGKREPTGLEEVSFAYEIFEKEEDLLRAVFSKIMDYPVIVTFNGDDFDLRYLQHRATREKGIKEEESPIQLERVAATLKHGIHIDLYQFFRNKSIQVYAFSNSYSEHTLGGISESLLHKSKIEFEGEIGDLPLPKLAEYCLNDSQLTYELTSMNDSLTMKLLLMISRIGKMPMNDVSRLGVSNWIRSLLFYEHRKIGALIPRQDELVEKGGASSKAIIKGKKYKGGLVIEPTPGAYFGVSVLDFASLHYNESIYVRKRQTGQVYKVKIGEFVNRYLTGGTDAGAKEIGPTWDVMSFDYLKQRATWKTVTSVIRHPVQPEVLEVITESGRRACVTGGHSFITLGRDGKRRTIKGSELKIGDYLVALSSFVAEQKDTSLDLLPYVKKLLEFEITRGSKGNGTTIIVRSKRSHRRFVLQRYLPLTPDLMWGFGYWVAEGWLGENDYGKSMMLEASSHDIEEAESKFRASGFNTWMAASKTPGCSLLGVGGRDYKGANVLPGRIVAALVGIWFGDCARKKDVPDWILRLPVDMRKAFVEGFYRGDGFNPSYHGQFVVNGKYKVGSYSQLLITNLMSLGLMSGFHCFSKNLKDPESFLTWSNGEHTYHKTKRPPPELLARTADVEAFANTSYYGTHRFHPRRYERVRKASVLAYEPEFEEFYKGNCHFETVKEIAKARNDLPVYDISVRGSESFFNGDGILLSNSLYPSLIKVYNLSYETVNCPHEECKTNKIPETDSWMCKKRKGITSLVVGSLRDLRVGHYKTLARDSTLSGEERNLYGVVSQALKVILNASYGSLGMESFSFYCLPVAEGTAALGRFAITKTIEECKEQGIPVIYGDTDSIFLKSPSKDQIATIIRWADKTLNVELDLDKTYRYIAFSSRKKNYFGVYPDGKVDIKGLTGRKSQTPEYLKKVFYQTLEVLSEVQSSEDFERARKETRELLTKMITNIKGRKVPVKELAFTVMMGKPTGKYNGTTPQHVRAAMQLEEKGKETKAGEIIAYVKTKNPPYVKPAELARPEEIDADKYIEYAHSMFDQLLDALDFSFDEIMGATTLDLFWSS